MSDNPEVCVVSLAVGGLYGPFREEAAARAWASREFPEHVWNVLPLTTVDQGDSKVGVFGLRTYEASGPTVHAPGHHA